MPELLRPFARLRMATRLAAAALLVQACGGAAPPPRAPERAPLEGGIARVEVAPAPGLDADAVAALETAGALAVLHQGALDWLEQAGRLEAGGPLEVRVEVESLSLRPPLVVWLLARLAGPDRLAVRVEARRGGETVREFRTGAASALAGFAWRDRGERLRRLARRVARRVAEGL